MSMTAVNLAPPAMVIAGVVALTLGYIRTGWTLIAVPILVGLAALVWALFANARERRRRGRV